MSWSSAVSIVDSPTGPGCGSAPRSSQTSDHVENSVYGPPGTLEEAHLLVTKEARLRPINSTKACLVAAMNRFEIADFDMPSDRLPIS